MPVTSVTMDNLASPIIDITFENGPSLNLYCHHVEIEHTYLQEINAYVYELRSPDKSFCEIGIVPDQDSISIRTDIMFLIDSIDAQRVEDLNRILTSIINAKKAKQTGRELTTMKNLEESIPGIRDPLSIVARHLTGNRGSLESQINKQKQKAGISLAPRPRKSRKSKKYLSYKSEL